MQMKKLVLWGVLPGLLFSSCSEYEPNTETDVVENILKLCVIIVSVLIITIIFVRPVLTAYLVERTSSPETMAEKSRFDKLRNAICLKIMICEIGIIILSAAFIGLDKIFDSGSFTAVIWACIDVPLLYWTHRKSKQWIKNSRVASVVDWIVGVCIIGAVYLLLPCFGLAEISPL